MNRRSFLQLLALTPLAGLLPKPKGYSTGWAKNDVATVDFSPVVDWSEPSFTRGIIYNAGTGRVVATIDLTTGEVVRPLLPPTPGEELIAELKEFQDDIERRVTDAFSVPRTQLCESFKRELLNAPQRTHQPSEQAEAQEAEGRQG